MDSWGIVTVIYRNFIKFIKKWQKKIEKDEDGDDGSILMVDKWVKGTQMREPVPPPVAVEDLSLTEVQEKLKKCS